MTVQAHNDMAGSVAHSLAHSFPTAVTMSESNNPTGSNLNLNGLMH